MASEAQVKRYLAYWFQLGKKVVINNGRETLLPQPVNLGANYSPQFEQCWEQVTSKESGDCYLEGTQEAIAELLTPAWDISACSRCAMPIPTKDVGMPPLLCPCNDLPTWPNTELPLPRDPVNSQSRLNQLQQRLANPSE